LHLFYTPDITGDFYTLNAEESRHCLKVLRLTEGDQIHLTDGKGNLFRALIHNVSGNHCQVRITKNLTGFENLQPTTDNRKLYGFRPYHLHIAIARPRALTGLNGSLKKPLKSASMKSLPYL